jgi:branched-subunit amino acid transport protein
MMWLVIAAVGLGSLAFRLVPLFVLQRAPVGEQGERRLRHAATSAVTALIVLSVRQGATGNATLPMLLAVVGAGLGAARGQSMLRLLISGGTTYAVATVAMNIVAR